MEVIKRIGLTISLRHGAAGALLKTKSSLLLTDQC